MEEIAHRLFDHTSTKKWQINRPSLRAGDLVYLKDKQVVRFEWPVGVIGKCLPSTGGNVRKAEVTRPKKESVKTFVHLISDLARATDDSKKR